MEGLVGTLMFGTLGFVAVFAYIEMRATDKMRGEDHPKSSLSKDGIEERLRARAEAETTCARAGHPARRGAPHLTITPPSPTGARIGRGRG